ncbi:MAG: hypothetical protein WKF87_08595 [Chryseolinea sp.]
MKHFRKYASPVLFALGSLFVFSCDDNDEIQVDPNAQFDAILQVNETGPADPDVIVNVNAISQSEIEAKVSFTSTTSMKRLYITQNIKGQGETIFEPTESIDLKDDGSVDLTGKNDKDFEFQFTLPVPSGLGTDGTVVYKFWATSGNGDFRDVNQRLIGTPGTITLKFGTSTNPAADVKTFANVKLSTPTADAKSMTFVSLLDGTVYKIEQGEEFITFWDFGYINLEDGGPALHATSSYPEIAIPSLGNLDETKNIVYFRNSTKTTAQFDAITKSSHLDFITTPGETFVKNLVTGDVVEFVDQYGKKGMIKVLEAMEGNESNKFIRIEIRVQP